MAELCSKNLSELRAWFEAEGHPAFRANQVVDWLVRKGVTNWEEMTNLSQSLRQQLASAIAFPALDLVRTQDSDDNETIKFLWKLGDGKLVESVLIMSGTRRTICVSTQVGCPARCAFCASGRNGFFRNLSTAEIVEQVVLINAWLLKKGERVSHVVYMGMGEPLENLDAVLKSIYWLTDPDLLGLSQRRITVSTVGVVEGIKALAATDLRVNLVLSLHAPNQHLRKKLIPYARRYEITDILAAMESYSEATGRDITYEYILLSGINDQGEHALELAQLLKNRQCTVNLIPYNPVPGLRLEKPTPEAINAFRNLLDRHRIINTCRYTKGDDIAAACGQLALQETATTEKATLTEQL